MAVSPAPDVTIRVFMLFKGLKEGDVHSIWSSAMTTADCDSARWRSIVGVDGTTLADDSLFRVLEWGGMEVL